MTRERSDSERTGLVLAAACLCQLVVVLDISVVNVALPHIDRALGFSPSSLSWVVNAYTLVFAGLLLLGGRIADLLGQRRTLLGGLALFGVVSLLGGLARTPGQLVAARAAQGLAAALLSPATLAVIMVTFREGDERRRAVATWGLVATAGGTLGVLLSGLLTEYLDWRWVFFVNVPIVLAAGALAFAAVHDPRAAERVRLDVVGAVLATVSMTMLAYGAVHAGARGWADAVTVSTLASAAISGAAFIGWERRADAPLIRLSVLRTPGVAVAMVIIALIGATAIASSYFLSLFLQNVLSYSAVSTGVAFLPFCIGMAASTMASPRLVERFGTRLVLAVGLTVGAVGVLGFTRLDVGSGYASFLIASIPASMGLGVSIAPTLSLGTSGVERGEAGMVSGLLNTSRQAGGGVALAVLATVASQADGTAGLRAHALADGYRTAFLFSGALLLAAAAIALAYVPRDIVPVAQQPAEAVS
jgi:EmrB/QacA subfamily drug resistance transporter